MTSVWCGCGKKLWERNDKKDVQRLAMCALCAETNDHTKSPYWDDTADKRALEALGKRMSDGKLEQPKTLKKNRRKRRE